MIELKTLASGSTGNAYLLSNGSSALLLEAGISAQRLQRLSGFRLSGLDGALVTHEHGDHASGALGVMRHGVDCYMSRGTAEALRASGHRLHIIRDLERFQIGSWTVLPFDTVHDAEEPLGFLLTDSVHKILFATDTRYLKYRFQGLTHLFVECNHSRPILRESVNQGVVHPALAHRIRQAHMSLETLQRMLAANDLSRAEEIRLLHLSDDNSDEEEFVRAVEEQTGIPTYVE
jgi:phosphoribosyl 1,2-cyclic phosphodiesterase